MGVRDGSFNDRPWVLVVEDDADCSEVLATTLGMAGVPVAVAGHGQEAVELLRNARRPPSLILSDVMMPVMDGIAFCRWKAAEPSLRDVPIVFLTASGSAREELQGLPVKGFLTKPFDFEMIAAMAWSFCSTAD